MQGYPPEVPWVLDGLDRLWRGVMRGQGYERHFPGWLMRLAVRTLLMEYGHSVVRSLFALACVTTNWWLRDHTVRRWCKLADFTAMHRALECACLSGDPLLAVRSAESVPPKERWLAWPKRDRESIMWARMVRELILDETDDWAEGLETLCPSAYLAYGLRAGTLESIRRGDAEDVHRRIAGLLTWHRDQVRRKDTTHQWLHGDFPQGISVYGLMLCRLASMKGIAVSFPPQSADPKRRLRCALGRRGNVVPWAEALMGVMPLALVQGADQALPWQSVMVDANSSLIDYGAVHTWIRETFPGAPTTVDRDSLGDFLPVEDG